MLIADRATLLAKVESEALRISARGPEMEVESEGKSMLIRLTAATTVLSLQTSQSVSGISSKIDQFAAGQFKMSPLRTE